MSTPLIKNLAGTFSRIRSALRRRGRSAEDAEDLTHEAWLRMARYQGDQVIENPEGFLMRTAINLAIDAHRTERTQGEPVMLDEVVLVDPAPAADAVVLARERMARLEVCLRRLTPRNREIFLANRVEGLSYREIADNYGLSTSTVEKHVAKAAAQIALWMEEW